VTEEDVERMRSLGLSDAEPFDVVAAAADRCFQADAAYAGLEPALRDALTVGRHIADD
jgi:hypothetical protein